MASPERDKITGTATTGHEWDGIKELNTPLPRWWLWTFYGTIVWAIAYSIAYPAWPLINSATAGLLGYSSRAEVAKEIAAAKAAQGQWLERISQSTVEEIAADPELLAFARAGGAAAFRVNCVQCHGSSNASHHRDQCDPLFLTDCHLTLSRHPPERNALDAPAHGFNALG
jgi:cytochrome c oxidase cbb3-type subunit 3